MTILADSSLKVTAALKHLGISNEHFLKALMTVRGNQRVTDPYPEEKYQALEKYARAGAILAGRSAGSVAADCQQLTQLLDDWVERTRISRLGQYGITAADFPKILQRSNGKNSPAELSQQQMAAILAARL